MNILNSLSKESAQKYLRYNELDYAMGELLNKEDFDEKLYAKYEAESDRLYKELWDKEWFRTLLDIKNGPRFRVTFTVRCISTLPEKLKQGMFSKDLTLTPNKGRKNAPTLTGTRLFSADAMVRVLR